MTINPARTKLAAEYKHEAPLLCCAFDPGGRFLFAGGRDRGVVVVNLGTRKKSLLAGHESWVAAAARAGDDLVLTADQAGRVIAWDCGGREPRQRWRVEAHTASINALAVSADGKSFATGCRLGTVRIWQTGDGKRTHELPRTEHPVYGVAWHPRAGRIVTADRQPRKPRVKVWDAATGKEQVAAELPELSGYRRVEDIEWGGIRGLAVSPGGRQIAVCGRTGYEGPACVVLLDASTGKVQRKLVSTFKGFYYAVRFHPQGFLTVSGGDVARGEVRTWEAGKEAPLAEVATPGPCTSLDIHPGGKRFAVTQTIGKRSYPETGALVTYDWTE